MSDQRRAFDLKVVPYGEDRIEPVAAWNARLKAGGATSHFPPAPYDPVPQPPPAIWREALLAVDAQGAVRGGYILKHQQFRVGREVHSLSQIGLPLSEGIVDRRFAPVGPMLLADAQRREPLLFGLGMGGMAEPLPRMLRAAGWRLWPVPFFFRIVHPQRFLREIVLLRRSKWRRVAMDVAAWSGAGGLAVRLGQWIKCPRPVRSPAGAWQVVEAFGSWADKVWRSAADHYGALAVRDAATLRMLYPEEDSRFIRLRFDRDRCAIGWAVLLSTQFEKHRHFGRMRVGTLVDCLAPPEIAPSVAAAARDHLVASGADLIVSNQSHAVWRRALTAAGFLAGPSNFLFATAPPLTQLADESGITTEDWHLNRGDGDGPINL